MTRRSNDPRRIRGAIFASRSSAPGCRASSARSSCARRASTTSRSTRRPSGSAAPGGRTPTRGSPATCPRTSTATRSSPNPDWSHRYSPGDEIQAYFEDVARSATTSRARSASATRSCAAPVATVAGSSRQRAVVRDEVDVVIAATGVLHHPRYPDIEGLDYVRGRAFHSARWDHDGAARRRAHRRHRHRLDRGADHVGRSSTARSRSRCSSAPRSG